MNLKYMNRKNKKETGKRLRCYNSGKISGLAHEEALSKFRAADMELYEAGYRSVNPMYSCIPSFAPWIVHIAWDICTLLRCDAVFFQKDWESSRGARLEHRVAKLAGKKILFQTEWGKNNFDPSQPLQKGCAWQQPSDLDQIQKKYLEYIKEDYNKYMLSVCEERMQMEMLRASRENAKRMDISFASPTWANEDVKRTIHKKAYLTQSEFENEVLYRMPQRSLANPSKQSGTTEQLQQPAQQKGERTNG